MFQALLVIAVEDLVSGKNYRRLYNSVATTIIQ